MYPIVIYRDENTREFPALVQSMNEDGSAHLHVFDHLGTVIKDHVTEGSGAGQFEKPSTNSGTAFAVSRIDEQVSNHETLLQELHNRISALESKVASQPLINRLFGGIGGMRTPDVSQLPSDTTSKPLQVSPNTSLPLETT